ncbi:MAG TPA: carboxypeptidase-like regulatory domain-containing protein, partial [Chitinophagaceae bacterium]|nr:carboxypeptidase-like regulatory domain-containing protein [Chitinophagaceae bacterium]
MRKLLKGLPIVLLFLANAVSAQQIKGIVQNEKGKGLKKATVSLLQAKDSSIAKLTATDNDGAFVFDMVQSGKYLIKTSFVGYQPAFTSVFTFTNNTINLPVISL